MESEYYEKQMNKMAIYEKGYQDAIDKACEWWNKLTAEGSKSGIGFPVTQGRIAEFRKAMEE